MAEQAQGSILAGMLWMFGLSLLLFWLPGLGGLIAGIVGGMKAGGVLPGLTAAILPAIVFAGALAAAATLLSGMPVLGLVAGMGGLVLGLAHAGPLLIGALLGGLFA